MKYFLLIVLYISVSSCTTKNETRDNKLIDKELKEIVQFDFQSLLDSSHVNGVILIFDYENNVYYSNDFQRANKGVLPASTYKIPNSIIALETGVVEDENTLFKWDGTKKLSPNWEQDLILKDAFQFSCVPCYRDIARQIGEKRMNEFLDKLNYGNMKVDSNNIDLFWLQGESKITPFQQIDFLSRFYHSKLPISKRTENILKKIMVIEENNEYILRGKTGLSSSNGKDNGWFVGYVKTKNQVYFFATNVESNEQVDIKEFSKTRTEMTYKALKLLEIVK